MRHVSAWPTMCCSTAVRSLVYGHLPTLPDLRYEAKSTGDLLQVNRPLYVSQHGQLSHSSS